MPLALYEGHCGTGGRSDGDLSALSAWLASKGACLTPIVGVRWKGNVLGASPNTRRPTFLHYDGTPRTDGSITSEMASQIVGRIVIARFACFLGAPMAGTSGVYCVAALGQPAPGDVCHAGT